VKQIERVADALEALLTVLAKQELQRGRRDD
jgi:hypothetical protein